MNKKERTIRSLVAQKEKAIIYLKNNTICLSFFEKARDEGFCFGSLPFRKWVTGRLIAVHHNGDMGHMPYFSLSRLNGECHDIVDFEKYIGGESDFHYVPQKR